MAIKRRKARAVRKTEQIRVLVSAAEKNRLIDGAFSQGLSAGAWLRLIGLNEAARLRKAGVVFPPAD
jgi:hypothetical protein